MHSGREQLPAALSLAVVCALVGVLLSDGAAHASTIGAPVLVTTRVWSRQSPSTSAAKVHLISRASQERIAGRQANRSGYRWQAAHGHHILSATQEYLRRPGDTYANGNGDALALPVPMIGTDQSSVTTEPSLCAWGPPPPAYCGTALNLNPGPDETSLPPPTGWHRTTPHQNQRVAIGSAANVFDGAVPRKTSPPLPPASVILAQLTNVNWTYKKIFGVEDIPPPPTAHGSVSTIYSPSVMKYNGRYVMMFGVATGCDVSSTWGADAIALAESPDGVNNWRFKKWILEPDARTCTTATGTWPQDMIHHVNDPSLFVQDSSTPGRQNLWVIYTAGAWHPEINNPELSCGHIGIAVFDNDYNPLYRNDRYLNGLNACDANHTGYSRPDLQWVSPGEVRLWFDNMGAVFQSTPVPRLDQLPFASHIRDELQSPGSADLNTPRLSYTETVLLQGGVAGFEPGVVARSRREPGGAWSSPVGITKLSGQEWDAWHHGSPSLHLDESTCTPLLYFMGGKRSSSWYPVGSVAVAIPPADKTFSFPVCKGGTADGGTNPTLASRFAAMQSQLLRITEVVASQYETDGARLRVPRGAPLRHQQNAQCP
jgi:hypothetical protein